MWEGNHPLREAESGGIAMGVINSVNAKERVCSVTTFSSSGVLTDHTIDRCIYLSPDCSPDGDELGSVPRRGATGIVFFISGVAFIGGYFNPFSFGGSAAHIGDGVPNLQEGDKVLSSKAKNRITLKRSGLIELYGGQSLQRQMFPIGSKIVDLCRDYLLKCDGGVLKWGPDEDGLTALLDAEYRHTLVEPL